MHLPFCHLYIASTAPFLYKAHSKCLLLTINIETRYCARSLFPSCSLLPYISQSHSNACISVISTAHHQSHSNGAWSNGMIPQRKNRTANAFWIVNAATARGACALAERLPAAYVGRLRVRVSPCPVLLFCLPPYPQCTPSSLVIRYWWSEQVLDAR